MLMPFQRAWQQLLLGAVVLGAALALPVLEQSHQMMGHDVHGIGDLGEVRAVLTVLRLRTGRRTPHPRK